MSIPDRCTRCQYRVTWGKNTELLQMIRHECGAGQPMLPQCEWFKSRTLSFDEDPLHFMDPK